MFELFYKIFSKFLLENSKDYLIFLIPGEELMLNLDCFQFYGKKREETFSLFTSTITETNIEERDKFFTHMIIWDKKTKSLAGGQRFLFSKKGCTKNKEHSYLEEYHPNTFLLLKNEDFCEIGRTFVMPSFQSKRLLKELIRGFIRIPESRNINIGIGLISFDHRNLKTTCINKFLNILNNSKKVH